MCFLVASCLIGFVISVYGYERLTEGLSPEKVGKAGVPKFPHGIAIHALQMLPLAAFVMRRLATPMQPRVLVIRWLTASFILQIIFASYQTCNGFARGDVHTPVGILLAITVAVSLIAPVVIVAKHYQRSAWQLVGKKAKDTA